MYEPTGRDLERGGPPYNSHEWKKWICDWGIKARRTTPYHPPTNWMVERFNLNLKLVIHAAYADRQDLEEKVAGQTSQGCQGKTQEGEGGCKKPPQQETPGPTPGVSSQRLHLPMEAAANLVTKVVHNQITGARDNTTSRRDQTD